MRVPSAGSRLAKSRMFQGSRVSGLQDSKVAGFQGYKAPGIQGCRFPWFQSSKILEFRGFSGFQRRKPFLEPLHECLAGIPCRKSCRNLSGRLNKTCGFSLGFVLLVCMFLYLMCGVASWVTTSWNHKTLKNLEGYAWNPIFLFPFAGFYLDRRTRNPRA